jgi:hypothetical protein
VKITKEKLKQIIKEELEAVYEQKNDRCPPGKTLQPENGKLVCLEEPMRLAEDGHEDSSSARRAMKTIIEDAPTWWTNKMAVAANNLNKMRDYLLVPSSELRGAAENIADLKFADRMRDREEFSD